MLAWLKVLVYIIVIIFMIWVFLNNTTPVKAPTSTESLNIPPLSSIVLNPQVRRNSFSTSYTTPVGGVMPKALIIP